MPHNQRGFSGALLVIAIAFSAFTYFGYSYLAKRDAERLKPSPQTEEASPVPALSEEAATQPSSQPSPSGNFIDQIVQTFADLDQDSFSDDGLNVTFKYPRKYTDYSLKSDLTHNSADLFFLADKNSDQEKSILDEIDCDKANRQKPSGVCSESILSDLDVTILSAEKVPFFGEEEKHNWQTCQKELKQKKVIYTCQRPVDAGRNGTVYTVYLNPEDHPMVLRAATLDATASAELAKTIIDTFSAIK